MTPHPLLTLAALFAAAAPVPDELPKLPTAPPPLHVLARVEPGGVVSVRQFHTVTEMVPRTETRVVNGQQVAYTVLAAVTKQAEGQVQYAEVRAFGPDGKRIEPKDLAGRLRSWTPVLLSADGNPVDAFYLQFVKDGTVILAVPTSKPAPPPAGAP